MVLDASPLGSKAQHDKLQAGRAGGVSLQLCMRGAGEWVVWVNVEGKGSWSTVGVCCVSRPEGGAALQAPVPSVVQRGTEANSVARRAPTPPKLLFSAKAGERPNPWSGFSSTRRLRDMPEACRYSNSAVALSRRALRVPSRTKQKRRTGVRRICISTLARGRSDRGSSLCSTQR